MHNAIYYGGNYKCYRHAAPRLSITDTMCDVMSFCFCRYATAWIWPKYDPTLNSMQLSSQELSDILRHMKIQCRVYKRNLLIPIVGKVSVVHTTPTYLPRIQTALPQWPSRQYAGFD